MTDCMTLEGSPPLLKTHSLILDDTLVGAVGLAVRGDRLARVVFLSGEDPSDFVVEGDARHPVLCSAREQLRAYFAGELREFDLPLLLDGTAFQCRVWRALMDIPYGVVRSYGDVAAAVNQPKAARAVGMANNRNRLPIVIPCHRVIGKDGQLVGFGSGIEIKQRLLALENPSGFPLVLPALDL